MKMIPMGFVSISFLCGAIAAGLGTAWFMNRSHLHEPDAITRALGKHVTLSNEFQEITFAEDGSIESIDNKKGHTKLLFKAQGRYVDFFEYADDADFGKGLYIFFSWSGSSKEADQLDIAYGTAPYNWRTLAQISLKDKKVLFPRQGD